MVSSIITKPQPGDKMVANTTFDILIQTRNMHVGFQTNPAASGLWRRPIRRISSSSGASMTWVTKRGFFVRR